MLNPESIYEVGGLLAAGYSLYQAQQHHATEVQRARERHKASMELAQKQHKKDLTEVKRTYLLELFTNLEQHFQQLNADLISSSKEAERDMFDQRNQSFQTIILASSVMFSALSTAIVQGKLPDDTGSLLIIAFSLVSALSFAFLFICMVICMELVMRASTFMYRRAYAHTSQLRCAINDTKKMMQRLRRGTRNRDEGDGLAPAASFPDLLRQTSDASSTRTFTSDGLSQKSTKRKHRTISELDEEALEREWRNHEQDLQEFMAERERINDATAIVGLSSSERGSGDQRRQTFQEFWNESCKFWAELSILFFYAGTVNLLLTTLVFMWAQFLVGYHSLIGAVIALSLISLALVIGIAGVVILRMLKLSERNRDPVNYQRRHQSQRNLLDSAYQEAIEPEDGPPRTSFSRSVSRTLFPFMNQGEVSGISSNGDGGTSPQTSSVGYDFDREETSRATFETKDIETGAVHPTRRPLLRQQTVPGASRQRFAYGAGNFN